MCDVYDTFSFEWIDLAAGVKAEGSGEMAQRVKVIAAKNDNRILISEIRVVDRENRLLNIVLLY